MVRLSLVRQKSECQNRDVNTGAPIVSEKNNDARVSSWSLFMRAMVSGIWIGGIM